VREPDAHPAAELNLSPRPQSEILVSVTRLMQSLCRRSALIREVLRSRDYYVFVVG
jgi:hypothetical protein